MGQKSRWQLPTTVHPTKYRRFVVCVPDEKFYIAAFQGLLIELTYSKNWQRDSAHTAASVSRLWQTILASVTCEQECAQAIQEMDYQMSVCEQLRIHEGKLQGFCCGKWVDIDGQDGKTLYGPGQDGGGTPQPTPGGDCQTYHATFDAKSLYLLPTVVSAGDTLEFSNPKGSGYDGSFGSVWHCPNGQTFFAGACIGSGGPSGGDPASSLDHMALVIEIGGVYYNAFSGTITVPGGVSNAQATIQTNDSNLSDNSGSYSVDIKVCNNAVPIWSHVWDFTLNPGAWVVDSGVGSAGAWVAGVGWTASDPTPSNPRGLALDLTFPSAVDVTSIELIFTNVTIGTDPTPTARNGYIGFALGGTTVMGTANVHINAGETHRELSGAAVSADSTGFNYQVSSGIPRNTGSLTCTRATITGTGIDPF